MSSTDARIKFSGEVDYSKRSAAYGSYKYLRVVPIGQGQAPALQLGSTVMTQFELPNNVMNLSKSKLVFDLTLPTASYTVGTAPVNVTNSNWLYANALTLIDRITLSSRAGTILADIHNCGIFGNIVSAACTKASDLATKTSFNLTGTLPATQAAALLKPVGDLVKCNALVNFQVNQSGAPMDPATGTCLGTAYVPYLEPLEVFSTPNSQSIIAYQINLDAFKHTLLELNEDIYFGDNLVLTITWQQATKYTFISGATDAPIAVRIAVPAGNAGVNAGAPIGTHVPINPPVMNNLSLFVACETNVDIVAGLIQKVNTEGFSLNVPFTYCQKLITPNSTSTAIQQRINSTYGSHLLR